MSPSPNASFSSISIVLRPLLGFGAGIYISYLWPTDSIVAILLLLFTLSGYVVIRLLPAPITNNWLTSASLLLLLIGFVSIGMLRYEMERPSTTSLPITDRAAIYSIKITEQSKASHHSSHYKGYITGCYSDSIGYEPLYIQTRLSTNMLYNPPKVGHILLCGRAEPLRILDNPDRFDYHQWLIDQEYQATMWVDSSRFRQIGIDEDLSFIARLRKDLLSQIDHHIDHPDSRSILKALALGYKLELNKETKQQFSQSGAMHLLVVSGLHTGIIFMMVQFLLFFLGNRAIERVIRFGILISLLWLYVAITGAANPVLRAAIMLTVMELSRLLSYRSLSFNNLFIAAFILLMIRPSDLFAVGFQLSFAAVASILYFNKYKKWWIPLSSSNSMRWIYDLIYISIGVQIGVAPLISFYFQSFPIWFLPANLLAIPLVTIMLPLYMLSVITSPITLLSNLLFGLLSLMLSLIREIISILAALPWSGYWRPTLDPIELAMFYMIIVMGVRWIVYPYYRRSIALLISIVIVLIYSSYDIYTSDKPYRPYILNDLRSSRLIVDKKGEYSGLDSGYIAHNHHSLYMMKGRQWYRKSTAIPLRVTYLVIDRHIYPSLESLESLFDYQILILDGSIRGERLAKWEMDIATVKPNAKYYSLYKTGGYILE